MKKAIVVAVLLCLATTAMADNRVIGQIVYPTDTTWQLWLTEVGPNDYTPAGLGILGFSIDLNGALPNGTSKLIGPGYTGIGFSVGDFAKTQPIWDPGFSAAGTLGWANSGSAAITSDGYIQPTAGQDTLHPVAYSYYFGVQAYSWQNPGGYYIGAAGDVPSYTYGGPTVPAGGTVAGVPVWAGPRAAGSLITWSNDPNRQKANIFTDMSGTPMQVAITMLPEPCTMAVLALGALAALRRRRA